MIKMAILVQLSFFILIVFTILPSLSSTQSSELLILHKPGSIRLHPTQERLSPSEIHHVIANTFGLDTTKGLQWHGLLTTSLFSRAKANVLITLTGFNGPRLDVTSVAEYPLTDDFPYVDVKELTRLIEGEFVDQRPLIIDLSLDQSVVLLQSHHPALFASLPLTASQMESRLTAPGSLLHRYNVRSLKSTRDEDRALFTELQLMLDVTATMQSHDAYTQQKMPDFYSFTVSSLQRLVELEGPASPRAQDAVALISDVIKDVKASFVELYKGNVMVEVVTMATSGSEPKMRIARSLKAAQATPADPAEALGVSQDYGADYPIIFNIILWLMIALVIATLLIAHSIWFMDPGRDSIIYRMTSQRMKKDN